MMLNYFDKVKDYLLEMGHEIVREDVAEGILIITNESKGLMNTMLDCEGEILVIEQHILNMDPNETNAHRRLLQINREVVHGAFVLNEDASMLLFRDTLQLSNLDPNELEGSLNALSIALIENTDELLSWAVNETIS
ncbi:MAG: YbjN domain-containing protein [Saprospiraceae bacterium]|nr:YbjN domain-containing protein [Saprospiraceae bacterium]